MKSFLRFVWSIDMKSFLRFVIDGAAVCSAGLFVYPTHGIWIAFACEFLVIAYGTYCYIDGATK